MLRATVFDKLTVFNRLNAAAEVTRRQQMQQLMRGSSTDHLIALDEAVAKVLQIRSQLLELGQPLLFSATQPSAIAQAKRQVQVACPCLVSLHG
jgi:hypothetical protein